MFLLEQKLDELDAMKLYPLQIFCDGNTKLLEKEKVSIIGSRRPSKYAREMTQKIAQGLAKRDVCIVSGGAMGIDAIAHKGARAHNTIAVLPCGIDIKYPAINKNLLTDIAKDGLLLSQFAVGFKATPWSFVVRNELVVALGSVLVVCEADLGSGSMRSVEFALKMGKKIFVLPHRLGESLATQKLLEEKKAEMIYDIESFCSKFGKNDILESQKEDDFLLFCKSLPSYEEALSKFPSRVFEAELAGEIEIKNSKVYLL